MRPIAVSTSQPPHFCGFGGSNRNASIGGRGQQFALSGTMKSCVGRVAPDILKTMFRPLPQATPWCGRVDLKCVATIINLCLRKATMAASSSSKSTAESCNAWLIGCTACSIPPTRPSNLVKPDGEPSLKRFSAVTNFRAGLWSVTESVRLMPGDSLPSCSPCAEKYYLSPEHE